MAKKIFYEKVGHRYKPVSEYDNDLMNAFPKGAHLVVCRPDSTSYRYNIDPNYAALIAAGRLAEDVISNSMIRHHELRLSCKDRNRELTPSQRAAWANLIAELGESARYLEWASVREIAEETVAALEDEAMKLMQHDSVRKAYDHFQLMCKLVKESNND